jgi:hypothetical protein
MRKKTYWCRAWESNPQWEKSQRILSPPRMPISPALHRLRSKQRISRLAPLSVFCCGAPWMKEIPPRVILHRFGHVLKNWRVRVRFSIIAFFVLALASAVASQSTPTTSSEAVVDNDYVRVFVQPADSRNVALSHKFDALCVSVFAAAPKVQHNKKIPDQPLPYVQADYFDRQEQQIMAIPMESDPLKSIWIEFKSQPPQSPFDRDAVKLDPQHNLVLFENSHVRVVRVHFGLGEKGPVVHKRPRVIILLNDMHADVARREGDPPSPRDGKAGAIQWSLGGSQATMNRNETVLDNIVVEIKGK